MTWTHTLLHDDLEASGTIDGGVYRAWVGDGVRPDGWTAWVQVWTPGQYYEALNARDLTDSAMAQIWCEAALLQLQRVAEVLR